MRAGAATEWVTRGDWNAAAWTRRKSDRGSAREAARCMGPLYAFSSDDRDEDNAEELISCPAKSKAFSRRTFMIICNHWLKPRRSIRTARSLDEARIDPAHALMGRITPQCDDDGLSPIIHLFASLSPQAESQKSPLRRQRRPQACSSAHPSLCATLCAPSLSAR